MFKDDPKTLVLTTKGVIKKGNVIIFVSHDEEDGMWQFLDDSEIIEENASIVSLEEIVKRDKSVVELSELSCGYIAMRENINDDWKIERYFGE